MPLLAYDRSGRIVAAMDFLVARTATGYGLVDFEATEAAGPLRDRLWTVSGAAGSGTWPEFLSTESLADFRVELDRAHVHPIRALVHVLSGFRRERRAVADAIAAREEAEAERLRSYLRPGRLVRIRGGVDVSDIIGSPERYLVLDDDGRTLAEADRDAERLPVVGHSGRPKVEQVGDHDDERDQPEHGQLEPPVPADVVDGRRVTRDGLAAVRTEQISPR